MVISKEQFESVRKQVTERPFSKISFTGKLSGLTYLHYRLLRPYLKWCYKQFQKQHTDYPWMAPDAMKALDLLLTREMQSFEFGSGRSTLFFAKRMKWVTSVEHANGWYNNVKKMLATEGIDNAELLLAAPDPAFRLPQLSSLQQISISAEDYPAKDELFEAYYQTINRFEDESLDLVVVDGRARVSCARAAIPKLKSGGILLLDNSERARYAVVHQWLAQWPGLVTTTGLTETTLWLKP